MDKENLITIGTLSKVTGVHIKSLYYYEEIGILVPVYINKKNGYRYYSHEQVLLVGWIQHFVDLGLPLKKLQDFISDNGHTIHTDELISFEISETEQRINHLQEKKELLLKMKTEIDFSKKALCTVQNGVSKFEQKIFMVKPIKAPFSLLSVQKELMKSFFELKELDLTPGSEMGLLRIGKTENETTYAFLEILSTKNRLNLPDILYIPAGDYQYTISDKSTIESARDTFSELYEMDYDRILIETSVLTSDSHPYQTLFQLRCSLPQ